MYIDEVVVNLFIAILVALVVARLSVKGFYKQEIWLRKEKKYSELIDQITIIQKHHFDIMQRWNGEIIDYVLYESEVIKARRDIELLSMRNTLLVDDKVSNIVSNIYEVLHNEFPDGEIAGEYKYNSKIYYEIKELKEQLIKMAKKDLNNKLNYT